MSAPALFRGGSLPRTAASNHSNKMEAKRGGAEMSFRFENKFSERWADWLRQKYGGSTRRISDVFGVSDRTARYWLDETSEPRGRQVAGEMARHPRAIPFLIGDRSGP